jgi:Beta-glucan synthesis-associated protein SKN1/KRE6/Sbg1
LPICAFHSHFDSQGHWYTHLEYSDKNISDLNPFFYGVTLVHSPKSLTYQSDAISANRQLNTTHYKEQHIYRVEWEPPAQDGTGGYIKWFTDGELVYGVKGSSLDIMQTEIPSEPMYLLMNTAVSSSWGFPMPCPDNCDCDCFECSNPACACALPKGYCENLPASFEIDYVRVYQAVGEERHVLGCSPEHRPTDLFIKGHQKRYMADGDKRPLEPVRRGGGPCTKNSECGKHGEMGDCSYGQCVCSSNFTGPHCLAHDGHYDFDTSTPRKPFSRKCPIDWKVLFATDPLTCAHPRFPAASEMIIPKSMAVVVVLLSIGFLLSMFGTIRAKSKRPHYQKIGNASAAGPNGFPTIVSYQDSAALHYALPPQMKKDVTYCVIDGRLVDDR